MSELRPFLDRLQERYHRAEYLGSDPIEFVHRYVAGSEPLDAEVVAIVSALLAYGNVRQIRRSIEGLLERMHAAAGGPAAFVRLPPVAQRRALAGYVHRFNTGDDLAALARVIGESWRRHGSVGAHFLAGLGDGDDDLAPALDRLIEDWRGWSERFGVPKDSSFHYFLTAPAKGSCCKRWCMLLRWMGRNDGIDPGLWAGASPLSSTFPAGRRLRPAQLVIPLDTHVSRITRYLGLTARATTDWKTAMQVTQALRQIDPEDPTRFDFALARLGILDLCRDRYEEQVCRACDLVSVCRHASAHAAKGARGPLRTRRG